MEENKSIEGYVKQFEYYRSLGEKAMSQVSDEDLNWRTTEEDNSIAIIVKHMKGNMLSRWTDFLTSDGEKEWRERDDEFESNTRTRQEIKDWWQEGWNCLFSALRPLSDSSLKEIVHIRNQEHSVQEAINRQLAHYAYHVGQIVLIAKIKAGPNWRALSIPRSGSKAYNSDKFDQKAQGGHYTDDWK